jgi:hypothetical protein
LSENTECGTHPALSGVNAAETAGGADSLADVFFWVSRDIYPGRWESGKLAFGFHFFPSPSLAELWGISPAFGEIPKGLVERVGSLPLAFHAFHSPAFPQLTPVWLRGRTRLDP